MYTDNDGQDTLPDESTREVIDYCRSIQGKDLEVFKLINPGDEVPGKDTPTGARGDYFNQMEALEGIRGAIDFYADYSEPVTGDELIEYEESDPEALLDLISVLRTTEALIRVRKSLPTSGLPSEDIGELDIELSQTIGQGAALLAAFFQNDHRYFYETVGDFDRRAAFDHFMADLCIELAKRLSEAAYELKDLQEDLNSILRGAELRGETQTASQLSCVLTKLKVNSAKKSRAFQEGAAKANEAKRLKTQETVRAFKLSLPPQEQNKPVTSALAVQYIIFHSKYNGHPNSTIDQRTAKRHLDKYWPVV